MPVKQTQSKQCHLNQNNTKYYANKQSYYSTQIRLSNNQAVFASNKQIKHKQTTQNTINSHKQ